MLNRTSVEQQVRQNLRWNFAVNLLDMTFFTLAVSLVSRETVMPVLISQLTDSTFAIGLAPAIHSLSFYLPQLLLANFSERLTYKKPFVMWLGGLGERTPYLLSALMIWLWATPAPTLTLVLFLLLLGIGSASSGTATPAWYDMIAKVIPVERRGIFSGIGHSLGALIGVLGAIWVGWILETVSYPSNFALCFGLATCAVIISFVGLSLTCEPPSVEVKAPIPLRQYLRQLPAVLASNPNYLRFLLSRTTMQLGSMATGFFMVYGRQRFQLSGADIGLFTAILVASQAVFNPFWGMLGDRKGYKVVLVCSASALMLAAFCAWLAPTTGWLMVTFVLLGSAQAGDAVSSFNIILEFCSPTDRPTYIGLTNTLLAPMLALAPLIGGWLAGGAGYSTLFLAAAMIAALGGLLMATWVHEPRRQSHSTSAANQVAT
jgi:MFS family permease